MAVHHHSPASADADGRDQAYRMVAELLVGYRRIVRRGLMRAYGDDWFESGCPNEVRTRILARQEAERGIDRFAADPEEPFGYATFADLAEILAKTEAVAGLLGALAASPERLCADLHALEELRSRVAGARAVTEQDQVFLVEMHLRLREKLAAARRRARGEAAPEGEDAVGGGADAGPAVDEPETEVPEPAPAEEVAVQLPAASEPEVEDRQRVSEQGQKPPADVTPRHAGVDPPETPRDAAAQPPADVSEQPPAPAAPRVYDPVGAAALDGAPTPVGLVRVDHDDLAILRNLRREIIAAAEAAYGHADAIEMGVWTSAWDSGWFSRKMEHYGLGEVATFYAVIEQYLDRRVRGDDRASTRTFLADREFAKLLLRLRELFLRLKV